VANDATRSGWAVFWQRPRRSWPYTPTSLEVLATRAGLDDDDELRELLGREIQRRRRERGEAWDALDKTLRMPGRVAVRVDLDSPARRVARRLLLC
jgi:hypothetical protein